MKLFLMVAATIAVMLPVPALAELQTPLKPYSGDGKKGEKWSEAISEEGNEGGNEEGSEIVEHVFVTVPLHRTDAKTALPLTVLTGDELRRSATANIGETLASKPGLASASFGPGVGQPVIRGQQGARVTVLQNSTSSADASNISADHGVNVEPVLAESIEVLKGPSTLLYGGGAIGGVVNVIDKRVPITVPDAFSGALEIRHGSVNKENSMVFRLDGGRGNVAFHLDGVRRVTDDVQIPGRAAHEDGETTEGYIANTDSEAGSYAAGLSHVFEQGFIGVAVNHLQNEYGVPPGSHGHHGGTIEDVIDGEGADHHDGDAYGDEGDLVRIEMAQTRYDIRADIHHAIKGVENIRWFFTYSDYEHDELEGDIVGTRWRNESWENRLELIHEPIANWHGVIGLQSVKKKVVAVGGEAFIPATTVEKHGIFIVEDYHQGDWLYELGGRIDFDSLKGESDSSDASFTSTSFSASALWQFNPRWRLGISLSQSQRAPVTEELFSNSENEFGDYVVHAATSVIEVGGGNLDRERANNIDLTLGYKSDRANGYVTVFLNDFRDYIFQEDSGREQEGVNILDYSQQDAKFLGFEYELTVDVAKALGGEFYWTVFGDRITGELAVAGDVPRLPPNRIGSRFEFERDGLSSYLSLVHAGRQDRPGENEEETAGYNRWDAGVDYRYAMQGGKELLAFVRVENIADETIRNASSFLRESAPEAGRSLEFGIRYFF